MATSTWILRSLISNIFLLCRQRNRKSVLGCIIRSLRALVYLREHKKLHQLHIVRHHLVGKWNVNLLHHLDQHFYLAKRLSVRERIDYLFTHYHFEENAFDQRYKAALYQTGGLLLWQREVSGNYFSITLTLSAPWTREGELSICLEVNEMTLHRQSFNWSKGSLFGLAEPVVPFIGCNQGASPYLDKNLAAFNSTFPNNSPNFFCFAAMQGVALAVGCKNVVAVNSKNNISFDSKIGNFFNAYEKLWLELGGVEISAGIYLVPLPFYSKPLEKIPSKHRKRAAMRRSFWKDISSSSQETICQYLIPKIVQPAPPASTADWPLCRCQTVPAHACDVECLALAGKSHSPQYRASGGPSFYT